jgi:hypothetical protein
MSEKRKFIVNATESYCTFIVRGPLTIDVDDYPQLQDKTDEEILEYVEWNSSDIYKEGNEEDGYSLWDEMMEQDVVREKITGEEVGVNIEKE